MTQANIYAQNSTVAFNSDTVSRIKSYDELWRSHEIIEFAMMRPRPCDSDVLNMLTHLVTLSNAVPNPGHTSLLVLFQVLRDGKEVQVAVPTVVAGDIVACLELQLPRGSLGPKALRGAPEAATQFTCSTFDR